MLLREFRQISRTGKTRVWTIEVKGRFIHTSYGELGGKMQTVTSEGVLKNAGKVNELTPEDDAFAEAERMILKQTRSGYTEHGVSAPTHIDWNAALPQNLRFYKPDNSFSSTLLKKLEARSAWLSRKRDGEMLVIVKGPDGMVDIYSRRMLLSHHLEEGEFVWADRFPDLVTEIMENDDIPPCSILLGDVVSDPINDGRWEVASFMKSLTPEALELPGLFFYCWDIAFWEGEDLLASTPVAVRYEIIWEYFGHTWNPSSLVVPVEVWEVETIRRSMGMLEAYVDEVDVAVTAAITWGWEGWVVVDPEGVYGDRGYNFRGKTDRPGKFCGKLKPAYEDDFIALFDPDGVVHNRGPQGKWGSGNNRGQVGAVSLYQYNAQGERVYICECGGGITDEFRAQYSDPRSYPLVLQIEYTDRTYRAAGDKTDALTHPRVVAVRTDKTTNECINRRL